MKKGTVVDRFVLPEHWYTVSEPTVVPKTTTDGSDGGVYVLLAVTHVPPEEETTTTER